MEMEMEGMKSREEPAEARQAELALVLVAAREALRSRGAATARAAAGWATRAARLLSSSSCAPGALAEAAGALAKEARESTLLSSSEAAGGAAEGDDGEAEDPVSAALLAARVVRPSGPNGRAAPRCALTWLPLPAAGRPWVCRVCGRRYSRSTGGSSPSPSSVVGGSHAGAPACVVCGVLVSPLVSSMGLSRPALP